MKPVIVTKELVSEGMSVMRGRDWIYSDQDEKPGNRGKVIGIQEGGMTGWAQVEWENGHKYIYRVGYENKYDLYVYAPGFYDVKPQGGMRLSYPNCSVGLKVKLNENASGFAKGYLTPGGKTSFTVRGYDATGVRLEGYSQTFKYESFDVCKDEPVKESVAKVAMDDGEKIQLRDPSSFKWGYTTPVLDTPAYKFRKGDIVYIQKTDAWTDSSRVLRDYPYTVEQVNGRTMKLLGITNWQLQDQFLSNLDYQVSKLYTQKQLTTTPLLDLRDLQHGTVGIAENLKSNKNSQNGNNTDNPDYSGRILELPSVIISLERGERIEGSRLHC